VPGCQAIGQNWDKTWFADNMDGQPLYDISDDGSTIPARPHPESGLFSAKEQDMRTTRLSGSLPYPEATAIFQ